MKKCYILIREWDNGWVGEPPDWEIVKVYTNYAEAIHARDVNHENRDIVSNEVFYIVEAELE